MNPQLLETLAESRWAIAFSTVAIAAVWLFQRGKTQRVALKCATACETVNPTMTRPPSVWLALAAEPANTSLIALTLHAFGKLPEITQRLCVIGTAVIGIVLSIATLVGVIITTAKTGGEYKVSRRHRIYNPQVYTSHAMTPTEPSAGHDQRAVFAANPPLPDQLSSVSVSATTEEEAAFQAPGLDHIAGSVSKFPPPTIERLIATEAWSSADALEPPRRGRFGQLAALTQCSCHDNVCPITCIEP